MRTSISRLTASPGVGAMSVSVSMSSKFVVPSFANGLFTVMRPGIVRDVDFGLVEYFLVLFHHKIAHEVVAKANPPNNLLFIYCIA